MKIYDESQVQKLIITAQAKEDRFLALYQLAVTTGMRQGELLGLKWQDIDWERRSIHVQRQLKRIPGGGLDFDPPKTKAGIRKIIFGIDTAKILKDHQHRQFAEMLTVGENWEDFELVFPSTVGTPMHPRNLLRRYKKLI